MISFVTVFIRFIVDRLQKEEEYPLRYCICATGWYIHPSLVRLYMIARKLLLACTNDVVIIAVEIIASVLEPLTVARDTGIGPSVIATFFSISADLTRVNLTLDASILLVVVAALRMN